MIDRTLIALTLLAVLLLGVGYSTDLENVSYTIRIFPDGSSEWIIESTTFLESEEEVKAFLDYIENFHLFKASVLENFTSRMIRVVEGASAMTGRKMSASDFDVTVDLIESIAGKMARIRYRFVWTNFADMKNSTIVVGDVFVGGFYLYEGDSMTIVIPEGYLLEEVVPKPDIKEENQLSWLGRRFFADKTPYVRISLISPDVISDVDGYGHQEPEVGGAVTRGGEEHADGIPAELQLLAMIVPLAVSITVVSVFFVKRRGDRRYSVKDADYVIRVIKDLGGSAFQKQIVEKTGFSKSKVSEILTSLEKNKVVERVKIGRERLIVLKRERKAEITDH